MKKTVCILISLLMVFFVSGCITIHLPAEPTPEAVPSETAPNTLPDPTAEILPDPTVIIVPEPELTAPLPSATPEGPEIYSSYAHMISLDVARGIAQFDYFEILRGDDAVQWLVEQEGYSQADAEALVADFADSEYIEKNTNPQIREINLTEIPLKLMVHPDGTYVEGAEPYETDYEDMYLLYEFDRNLVLNTYFYYIEAENGQAVCVAQVYWP